MRIGGLASGMDIDSMVADLMKAERLPMQKMQQDRTWMTWQRDAFREVNTKFLNFRSELTKMKLSTTFRSRMTSATNENYVSATATSAAGLSSYTISKVDKLATAATKVNGGRVFGSDTEDAKTVDTRKSLAELKSSFSSTTESSTTESKTTKFEWEHGSVKKETINLDEAKKVVKLNLQDGTKLTNPVDIHVGEEIETGNMSVKVGNSYYKVVMGKDAKNLASNEVLLNDTTNELTFKENLPKGSDIKVNYTTDLQIDTMKTAADGNKIKLSNQEISEDEFEMKIGDVGYVVNDSKIYLSGDDQKKDIQQGTLDKATGIITMNEAIPKDTEVKVTYKYDYTSFRVGAHTKDGEKEEAFNIKASQSFDSMISQVNSANVGVSMFYDSVTGKMTLNRTETGNFNGAEYTDPDNPGDSEIITKGSFIQDQLNFSNATETGGNDAHFTINGLSTTRSSNSFTISGVTFNLKQTFSAEDVTVNISNDSNTVFENIKGFVEKYNELIGGIQDRLQEDRYKDYRPLTDKQREEMSDKQQELWEEKSKSGLLRRDSTLSSALNDMRRDFYTPVNNGEIPSAMQQLASIGISTTANYLEGGKLEINESKLKKAIEENPEAVEKLFKNDGTGYGQQGILDRLTDTANKVMDTIKTKAGNTFQTENQYTMGRQLDDLKDRISSFEKRLVQVEDRYWRQFTAMEKAIQRANQQSMYLMQQFGGGM